MCLSAKDAKVAAAVAELVAPDSAKPYIHAVNESVHVNENNNLEVDVNAAIANAQPFIKD